jgi:hypothetical protein
MAFVGKVAKKQGEEGIGTLEALRGTFRSL